MSGKLGALGVALPEDELEVMRKANQDLIRWVPLVQLAIAAWESRTQRKRQLEEPFPARPSQEPRTTPAARWALARGESVASLATTGDVPTLAETDVPAIRMQLVSDHPVARAGSEQPLSTFEIRELRALSSASCVSVDSGSEPDPMKRTLVFGRQEVWNKLPRAMMPPKGSEPSKPMTHFVSRNLFVLAVSVMPPPPAEAKDTLDMATCPMGEADESSAMAYEGATLPWGSPTKAKVPRLEKAVLANAIGKTSAGMHVRVAGETTWRWVAKESSWPIHEGDRIAILMESPPGSSNPCASHDLEAKDAVCILGAELLPPTSSPVSQ